MFQLRLHAGGFHPLVVPHQLLQRFILSYTPKERAYSWLPLITMYPSKLLPKALVWSPELPKLNHWRESTPTPYAG